MQQNVYFCCKMKKMVKEVLIEDRLDFLVKKFDVFEPTDDMGPNKYPNYFIKEIRDNEGDLLAFLYIEDAGGKPIKESVLKKKVSISLETFIAIVNADPTLNKVFVQWMLEVFVSMVKDYKNIDKAIMFVKEDLPQASRYLQLFNANKRKKRFYDLCKKSHLVKEIHDPSNINQYKSLAQLFDAVDPFIEKDVSSLEKLMLKYVELGEAEIPVKDRYYTVFVPKTKEANILFSELSSWCTARVGNSNFDSYTSGNKKPNGRNSDIYIIINNDLFNGKSDEIYQIHFETNQLKDKYNNENKVISNTVLAKSSAIKNYFYHELIAMAKEFNKGIDNNYYLDYLIKFGFEDVYFEIYSEETESIKIMNKKLNKIPNVSKFKKLKYLLLTEANISTIDDSICELSELRFLVLRDNKITSLPKNIGMLKNLNFLHLFGNEINNIPDSIALLDKQNGGSLVSIEIEKDKIGSENYEKIKRLLPTTLITE